MDQQVLADLGWKLELDDIVERCVGKSEARFVASVEEHLGIRLADGWDQDYAPWYQDAFERRLEAVDGEDSAYGVQAARAAGMHGFAYAGGVTPAARPAGPGATVFSDMRQLPALIAAGRP